MQDEAEHSRDLSHVIFVYGTLKRGQPNYHIMEQFGNYQFVGTGCTKLKYPLIIYTKANLPCMLDAPGIGQVHGILFAFTLLSVSFFVNVIAISVSC